LLKVWLEKIRKKRIRGPVTSRGLQHGPADAGNKFSWMTFNWQWPCARNLCRPHSG